MLARFAVQTISKYNRWQWEYTESWSMSNLINLQRALPVLAVTAILIARISGGAERPGRVVRQQQDRQAEHADRHRAQRRQHDRRARPRQAQQRAVAAQALQGAPSSVSSARLRSGPPP